VIQATVVQILRCAQDDNLEQRLLRRVFRRPAHGDRDSPTVTVDPLT
jgi:hypothetical protein